MEMKKMKKIEKLLSSFESKKKVFDDAFRNNAIHFNEWQEKTTPYCRAIGRCNKLIERQLPNFGSWREVIMAADKVVSNDNFVTAYVDGKGIGTAATRCDDWAFIPIGGETYSGVKLTPEYYAVLKAASK